MKSLVASLVIVSLLFSCGDKDSGKVPPSKKYDTSLVQGIALAPDKSRIVDGIFQRVVVDSADIIYQPDSTTWKKTVGVDTFYRVPYDSWIDSTNTGWIDSAAGRKKGIAFWNTHKDFVRSGWVGLDSSIEYLKKFIKKN